MKLNRFIAEHGCIAIDLYPQVKIADNGMSHLVRHLADDAFCIRLVSRVAVFSINNASLEQGDPAGQQPGDEMFIAFKRQQF